jgi:hypothetical protein
MAATFLRVLTLRDAMNTGDITSQAAAQQQILLGNMCAMVKVVVTGLTAAATVNITTAATLAAATVTGIALAGDGELLPPIGHVRTLRVTAVGTGATGPRVVTDAGGTAIAPSAGIAGVALLSDDGTTLTFEGTVTGFVLEYFPAPALPLSTSPTADIGAP